MGRAASPCLVLGVLATLASSRDNSAAAVLDETISHDALRGLHLKMDGDGNGKVSLSEVMSFAHDAMRASLAKDKQETFDELDMDKDKRLSLEEHLADFLAELQGDDAEEGELSGEGLVSLEKVKFQAADMDGDGFVDIDEAAGLFYHELNPAVLDIHVKAAMTSKDKDGNKLLDMKEFWDMVDEDDVLADEERKDFKRVDGNGDGFVDLDELSHWESGHFYTQVAMKELFDFADENRDAHLTADELAKARGQILTSDSHEQLLDWAGHFEL